MIYNEEEPTEIAEGRSSEKKAVAIFSGIRRKTEVTGIALLMIVAASLLFTSCEFVSYDEWEMVPYDGEITWTQVNEDPPFSNRINHTAVSFNGKLWVFGGYDQGAFSTDPYMEDVWSSSDGISWSKVTSNAPWKGRRGHASIVFNGYIYILGGFVVDEDTGERGYRNDIWRTVDGVNWEEVIANAAWPARFEHVVVEANHGGTDYLYLMTGMSMRESGSGLYSTVYYNDVWRSADGVNWTEMVTSQNIGQRCSAAAFVDPATNRIHLFSGMSPVMFDDGADGSYNGKPSLNWDRMWFTDDGSTWTPSGVPNIHRADFEIMPLDGRFWILPGKNNSTTHLLYAGHENYYNTYYFNGSWVLDSESSGVGARYGYASALHNGKVWIIGGRTADDGPDNDVWAATL